MENHVDAVLFDFHGTLVSSRAQEWWVRQARARMDASTESAGQAVVPDGLLEGLSKVWRLARRRDPECLWDLSSEAHRAAFVTVLAEDLGCPQDLAEAMYEVMPDQWEVFGEACGVLARLAEAGLALGIISNIGIDIRPRLRTLGILAFFDAVVMSYEVGVTKPDR